MGILIKIPSSRSSAVTDCIPCQACLLSLSLLSLVIIWSWYRRLFQSICYKDISGSLAGAVGLGVAVESYKALVDTCGTIWRMDSSGMLPVQAMASLLWTFISVRPNTLSSQSNEATFSPRSLRSISIPEQVLVVEISDSGFDAALNDGFQISGILCMPIIAVIVFLTDTIRNQSHHK